MESRLEKKILHLFFMLMDFCAFCFVDFFGGAFLGFWNVRHQ